jgi:hypothetical protein
MAISISRILSQLRIPIPISLGGTGSTSQGAARTSLGVSAVYTGNIDTLADTGSGFYSYNLNVSTTGTLPAGVGSLNGGLLTQLTWDINAASQLLVLANTQYLRTKSGGVWTAWRIDFDTTSLTSTRLITQLGFTPVRQGTGTGQLSNTLHMGWDGANILAQVDGVALGTLFYEANVNNVAYIAPTLENGWTAGGRKVGYRKRFNSVELIFGLYGSGAVITDGTVLFTLPVGYRPTAEILAPLAGGGANGRFTVGTNGQVQIFGLTVATNIGACITFGLN